MRHNAAANARGLRHGRHNAADVPSNYFCMTSMPQRDNGPMQVPVNNKRGQVRFSNRLPMQIELGNERLEGNSRNLSLGGTFIETHAAGGALREGARIRLRFSVPTQPDPIVTE